MTPIDFVTSSAKVMLNCSPDTHVVRVRGCGSWAKHGEAEGCCLKVILESPPELGELHISGSAQRNTNYINCIICIIYIIHIIYIIYIYNMIRNMIQ